MNTFLVDINKCTGCMVCVLECSFFHEKAYSRSRSRIQIKRNEEKELSIPLICEQCDFRECVSACILGALVYDNSLNIPIVDEEACVGCGACAKACSFKAIHLDPTMRKAIVCDLCDGDPTCVKVCLPGAIRYKPVNNRVLGCKAKAMDAKLKALKQEFEGDE